MDDDDPAARARVLEARLNLLATLLSVLYAVWLLTPPHVRRQWAMQAVTKARTVLHQLATLAGTVEIRRELKGGRPTYDVPYALSQVRDKMAECYERLRQAT